MVATYVEDLSFRHLGRGVLGVVESAEKGDFTGLARGGNLSGN